jgi:hypothetical protein
MDEHTTGEERIITTTGNSQLRYGARRQIGSLSAACGAQSEIGFYKMKRSDVK